MTVGADGPGHGRRRHRQHRVAAPVGGRRRAPCSSARRPSGRPSGAIAFEAVGEQELKGKAAPGRRSGAPSASSRGAAATAAAAGARAAVRRSRRGAAAAQGAASTPPSASGKPRLVTSIGQAGIGKSRLAWELEKYLDGVVETIVWHEGRSPAYGEGISYWALAEMVRGRAGIAESDDPRRRPRQARGRCSPSWSPDAGGAALDRAAPGRAARPGRAAGRDARGAVRRVAHVLRAHRRSRRRRCSSSGTCNGPTRACSTSSSTCSSWARTCRSSSSPWRGPSCSSAARAGARRAERDDDPPRATAATPTMARDASAACVPGSRTQRSRAIVDRGRGRPALRGRDAPHADRPRPSRARDGDRYELRRRTLDELAVPETLHALIAARLDALDARGPDPAPGCGGPRPELHAAGVAGVAGRRGRGARRRGSSDSSRATC